MHGLWKITCYILRSGGETSRLEIARLAVLRTIRMKTCRPAALTRSLRKYLSIYVGWDMRVCCDEWPYKWHLFAWYAVAILMVPLQFLAAAGKSNPSFCFYI